MKIVVNTNILFSFFWQKSLTRKLLITSSLDLISPEFALFEIEKYSQDIIEKIKITKKWKLMIKKIVFAIIFFKMN